MWLIELYIHQRDGNIKKLEAPLNESIGGIFIGRYVKPGNIYSSLILNEDVCGDKDTAHRISRTLFFLKLENQKLFLTNQSKATIILGGESVLSGAVVCVRNGSEVTVAKWQPSDSTFMVTITMKFVQKQMSVRLSSQLDRERRDLTIRLRNIGANCTDSLDHSTTHYICPAVIRKSVSYSILLAIVLPNVELVNTAWVSRFCDAYQQPNWVDVSSKTVHLHSDVLALCENAAENPLASNMTNRRCVDLYRNRESLFRNIVILFNGKDSDIQTLVERCGGTVLKLYEMNLDQQRDELVRIFNRENGLNYLFEIPDSKSSTPTELAHCRRINRDHIISSILYSDVSVLGIPTDRALLHVENSIRREVSHANTNTPSKKSLKSDDTSFYSKLPLYKPISDFTRQANSPQREFQSQNEQTEQKLGHATILTMLSKPSGQDRPIASTPTTEMGTPHFESQSSDESIPRSQSRVGDWISVSKTHNGVSVSPTPTTSSSPPVQRRKFRKNRLLGKRYREENDYLSKLDASTTIL